MANTFDLLKQRSNTKIVGNAVLEKSLQEGTEAKEFLAKPWYKQLFTKQVAQELPSAIAETAIGTPAKFITSALEVPETFIKGQASQRTYNLPGLKPFQSYQTEAQKRGEQIVSGEKPLYSALTPFAEIPLAGIETAVLGKGAIETGKKGISILAKSREKKALQSALKATAPVLTKSQQISVLEKSGQKGGAQIKGISQTITKQPTDREIEIAKDIKKVKGFNSNGSPVKNAEYVNKEITRISEKEITPYLKNNSVKVYPNVIARKIATIEPPDYIRTEKSLENIFDLVKKRGMEQVLQKGDTNFGLWEARKKFDDIIEEQFGNNIWNPEKNSAVKSAVIQVREIINDSIAKMTPSGKTNFSDKIRNLSNLYRARHNIAEQNYKLLNSNAFTRILMRHPNIKRATQAVGWLGLGYGATRLLGGGSIGQSNIE